MAQLIMAEGTTPATPSTGKAAIFINANGILCVIDDAGTVYAMAPSQQAVTFTGAVTLNKLIYGAGADLTIASGVVTITHSRHSIDTQAAAATDDLDTINGGSTNQMLIISTVSSTRDVVLKHATGNILTYTGADETIGASSVRKMLMYDGTNWRGLN